MASPPELAHSSSASDDEMEKGGSERHYTRSESVQSGSTEALDPLTENTQLLRLETLSDSESRVSYHFKCLQLRLCPLVLQVVSSSSHPPYCVQWMIGCMKGTAIIAMALGIVVFAVKQTRPDLVVLNRTQTIMNICWNAAGIAGLVFLYVRSVWRVVASRLAKKYWSDRRWKAVVVCHRQLQRSGLSRGCIPGAHAVQRLARL